jgi:hypothetical protein
MVVSFVAASLAVPLLCVAPSSRADDQASEAQPVERLTLLRLLTAPGDVVDADGVRRPVAELSGITWLGGASYAAVMDGSDRLLVLDVDVGPDTDAVPPTVVYKGTVELDRRRDWEDIATHPGEGRSRRWFLVEEDTPAVRGFVATDAEAPGNALAPLRHVGAVSLAIPFRTARPNRGPEGLALEPDGRRLWTVNEEPLSRDGPAVAEGVSGRVRLVGLDVDPDSGLGEASDPVSTRREVVYEVDPAHARVGLPGGPLYSGVVALVALGEGRLIVLERSAAAGVPPFENRFYLVDTTTAGEARDIDGELGSPDVTPVAKGLLWKGALGVNLEGICVGPRLPDGSVLIVGVADNGAEGTGEPKPNPFALFRLTDQPTDGNVITGR